MTRSNRSKELVIPLFFLIVSCKEGFGVAGFAAGVVAAAVVGVGVGAADAGEGLNADDPIDGADFPNPADPEDVPADLTSGVEDPNDGVDLLNAVDDVVGEGVLGAGNLLFMSFIRGLVVALVPLVLSLSAAEAASFGFAFAN